MATWSFVAIIRTAKDDGNGTVLQAHGSMERGYFEIMAVFRVLDWVVTT